MATWYRTAAYSRTKIEPVEVEKVTEHFVYIKGQRNSKSSSYDAYHETYEQAHTFLLDRAVADVARATERLERIKQDLEEVKKLEFERPR